MEEKNLHVRIVPMTADHLDEVAELERIGLPYSRLTGDTVDRETPVRRFQEGEVPVFLISLKAGGVGLKNVVLQMHMVLGLANGVHDGIKGARPANEQLHLLGGGQGQVRGIADQAHQLLQPRRRLGCAVAQMRQALAAHACFGPAAPAL